MVHGEEKKKTQTNFMEQEIQRQQFLALGLTDRQIQSLLSKFPDSIIETLLSLSNVEWQQIKAMFNVDDLIRGPEACAHVRALIPLGSQLINLGYSSQQVLSIAQYKTVKKILKPYYLHTICSNNTDCKNFRLCI